jgi:hypothetical protein
VVWVYLLRLIRIVIGLEKGKMLELKYNLFGGKK